MYAVAIFALALLSPLPFISPFDYIMQDATAQSSSTQNVPLPEFADIVTPSPFGTTPVYKPRTVTPFEIDDFSYAVITGDGNSSTLLSIANITNPNSPSVMSYSNTSSGLGNIFYSHVFTINDSTYVMVSDNAADSVGIINISNPSLPVPLVNTSNGEYPKLDNPRGITTTTIGSSTYALVTSFNGKGIQIINVTDPSKPSPVYYITDDADGYDYPKLKGAWSVTTTTIGSSIYALATAYSDSGVQIINITDPNLPLPVADITNGTEYPMLNGPRALTTVTLDSFTYALVVDFVGNGVQIINITEPNLPSPVANIVHGEEYLTLNGSRGITTVTLGPFTYALVTAFRDNSVQIINITDPASPSPVTSITHNAADYAKLRGAYGIATTTINSSLYALVASYHTGMQIIGLDHGFISAYTSNQNPKYAKAGDTLIINFNASGTIASHTSQILELNANVIVNVNGAVYNATVTVPSTPREAYATFMINVTNTQGTNATITENDISLSNVFIDTIPPSIELIGSADYTILSGTPSSSIPNVTVSDGDPNYVENFTLVVNDTVDTTMIGSAYNFTYTAYPDTAGNPGSSTSRIVTVMDIPSFEIIPKLAVSPFGTIENGTNGFNSIGHPEIINTFKIDNFTYAGVFHYDSNYFTIINITDPSSPSQVYVLDNTVNSLYNITDAAYTVIDGLTYAISTSKENDRVLIINVSNPSDPFFVTSVTYDANYPELFAPYDITTVTIGTSTFAIVVSQNGDGVQIIDITDPDNPIPASAIADDVDGYTELRGAASVTTVTLGTSTFALVAAFADQGVQIINITDPYNPTLASNIAQGMDNYTELNNPRSIITVTIDTSTFALVADSYGDGVQIINITDPYNPIAASAITNGTDNYTRLGYPYDITAVTINSSTFALVAAILDNGVQIIDITDPYNPTPEFAITNDKDGYTALHGASSITTVTIDSSTFALVTAIQSSSIQIIKLEQEYISAYTSNQNPKYAKAGDTLEISFTTSGIITAQSSHILGLDANANVAVNGAVYNAMVIVPSTPRESYATFTINVANAHGTSVTITENNISSSNVFIDTIPPSIELIGSADYIILPGAPSSSIPNVTVSDGDPNYVENFTLVINDTVDTTRIGDVYNYTYTAYPDPAGNPGSSTSRIVTVMDVPSVEIIPKLAVSPFGVIQNGTNGFNSIGRPVTINTFKIDNFTYAGVFGVLSNSFTIINITDPSSPSPVYVLDNTVNSLYNITDAAYTVIDGLTYAISISKENDRVLIINVSNPSDPFFVTSVTYDANYPELFAPYDITTVKIGTSTFAIVVSHHGHGVQIIDITDPDNPIPASAIADDVDGYTELRGGASVTTVTIGTSTFALVAAFADHGVQIINITDPYNPTLASNIAQGMDNYTKLNNPRSIITVTIDTSTFALVADYRGNGVQIINITDPYNPIAASAITNGMDNYTRLGYPYDITAVTINSSTFALVVAVLDDGVQIIDITDPYNPTPEFAITNDKDGYTALDGASSITTVTIDSSTFALVTAVQSNNIQIIKLEQEYISAYTSNQNPKYAKAGDTLDITFTANDTLAYHTSQILGLDANVIVNDAVYNAMVIVPSTPMESYATFTINVANAHGTSVTITENNISSSNVFIDTIPPSIELIGSADYTILSGTPSSSIPNVTVSDGDPNYVENFTLVINDTVDTTRIGNVYNYTYTAYPDTAGNPGSSTSRIVTVMNPPFEIIPKLSVSPFGVIQNGMNGFDSIEKPTRIDTFQIGDSIYAGVSGNFSFTIVNITDPSSPSQVTVLDTTVDSMFALSVGEFVVIDGFTYAISTSDDDESVLIINISNPSLPSLVTHITHDADYTGLDNPFGITTVTINSSTYALVTAFNGNGVQIIDITDPSNPSPVSVITDGVGGYEELYGAIHVTTVTIDSSTFALVASVWDNGVQIIDITDPYNPAPASAITHGVGGYTELDDPHAVTTVTIDSSTFALAAAISGDGVQIIDITDPYNPIPASALTDGRDGFTELDGSRFVTTITIDTSMYALVAGFYDNGVQIIDITDPYNPIPASALADGKDGYTKLHNPESIIAVTIDSSAYALVASSGGIGGVQIIKLGQEYISVHTNNQNPKYAKAGDTLDITFTANDTIASHTSQILGLDANVIVNDTVYNAMVTVPSTPMESYATFTINVTNAQGTSAIITENNISSSNVFIDTMPPSIELIGSADYTVLPGTADPFILNVTVSDGDPNYMGGFTLVKNDTVNTSKIDSAYNYTYTAYSDTAGNPGASTSRIITVMDIGPINVTSLDIASNGASKNFANEGKNITVTLVTDSTDLIHFTGNLSGKPFTATTINGTAEFTATVSSNDPNGKVTFSITATNSDGKRVTLTDDDLTNKSSFVIIDTVSPTITLNGMSNTVVSVGYSYTDLHAIASDSTYANGDITVKGIGNVNTNLTGIYTINYTAPDDVAGNPGSTIYRTVNVTNVPSFEITPDLATSGLPYIDNDTIGFDSIVKPKKINTFKIADLTYAGVYSDSNTDSFTIVDITDPSSPSQVSVLDPTVNSLYTITDAAYAEIDGLTYAISISKNDHNVVIINVSDPSMTRLVTHITDGSDYKLHEPLDIATVKIDTSTFALVAANKSNSIQIINITNPSTPTPASNITDGEGDYTKLKGPRSIATVTIDTSIFALVAASENGVQIINITDPYNPTPASNISHGVGDYTELSDPRSIATVTIGTSTFALVAAYGEDNLGGVQIINITDPYNPTSASAIDQADAGYEALAYAIDITTVTLGSSTFALVVSEFANGVQIIDITNPYAPTAVDALLNTEQDYRLDNPTSIATTTIDKITYALVTAHANDGGIQIIKLEQEQGYVSTSTSNKNPKYAKAGDTLNINFNASGTIASHTSQILGLNANENATVSGAVYNATVTVPSVPMESYIAFTIQITNTDGTSATITQNDISSKNNIFVDTISPSIELVGSADYFIMQDAGTFSIPNVTASDGDPNYMGGFELVENDTINTAIVGSAYNYTYTANPDAAGNLGDSISRIITIRAPPLEIIPNLATSGLPYIDNDTIGFDSIVKPKKINTFKIADLTYAGVYSDSNTDSFTIVDITDPSSPSQVSVLDPTVNSLYTITDAAYAEIDGLTYAISISKNDHNVVIINVSDPSMPRLVTHITDGSDYKLHEPLDIATVKIDTSTFALVAANKSNSIQIINITNPSTPTPASNITDGEGDYTKLKGPRSIATVTIDTSIFALVAASENGVQIINITDPYNPTPASNISHGVGDYTELSDPRSITTVTIGTSTFALVAAYGEDNLGGVQIINITDPYNPTSASAIDQADAGYEALAYAIDITTVTLGSSTFALVVSEFTNGVQIIDITNPYAPTAVDALLNTDQNYRLDNPTSIATTTIDKITYALVTAHANDGGIQIIKLEQEQGYVSTSTSNKNPKYAKAGDTLEINFITSGPIASHTSQILGLNANENVTVSGAVYNATVTVPSVPMESYATFRIQIVNTHGPSVTITENDISSKNNIFVDTISPSIELVGSADYFIMQDADTFSIPNVTASDGDPNYMGGFELVENDTINTAIVGSAYNYTYTANPDAAGNPGDGISRIITIYAKPITITSLNITSNGAFNNFANEGKNITVALATDSDDLGDFTGNLFGKSFTTMTSNGAAEFTATVSSNDPNGKVTFSITATNSDGKNVTFTHDDLTNKSSFVIIDTVSPTITLNGMSNTIVSVGDSYTDLHAIASDSTYANGDMTIKGIGDVNTNLAGIYTLNYTAPDDMAGNLGSTIYRTVNVTNVPSFEITPDLATSGFKYIDNDTTGFDSIVNPEKINTFKIGNSIYAGVYSDSNTDSFTIVDITDPSSPEQVSVLDPTVNSLYTITDAAYAEIDGLTYAISISKNDHNVVIININNPRLPFYVTHVTDGSDYKLHEPLDIATVKIDTSTFALVAANKSNSIQIINITNPSTPTPASNITDGEGDYTKLKGPRSIATVTIDTSIFALVAASENGVQIINITDPYNPTPASNISHSVGDYTELYDPRSITTVTIGTSTFALVAAYGVDNLGGVQIINITDPYNPTSASAIDQADDGYEALSYAIDITTVTLGSSTFALVVSEFTNGVQIIDITNPYAPTAVDALLNTDQNYRLDNPTSIATTTIDKITYALVTAHANDGGIQIIKLDPMLISTSTSNQNPKYAKAGDTLNINFNASGTIASHTSQILGSATNPIVSGTVYNATVTVPSEQLESYITFTIQITNTDGTSATITQNDITSKNNIFVDTISPSIKLVGPADYAIPYGTLDPFIPNVTVSDGDPNYVGGFELVENDTIDTTMVGSVYQYTYTANTDSSGNVGNNVTRTIFIVDHPSNSCMDPELSYNIIIGNNSSKTLNGTADNDVIYGTDGNDTINGLGGNDCIFGNGGNDTINGGDGNDTIDGGDGNDKINGGNDDDIIQGGYGLDEINGDAGNDNLYGNDDDDTINGGKGNDRIDGGLHDDVINGGEGDDLIHGNDGSDILHGSSGNDNLYGGEDADMIYGGNNDDAIHGGTGDDVLHGEDGHDVIHGNTNNDVIYGGDGDDIIDGGRQNDIIDGGAGNDRIKGSHGNDEINGSAGDDDIFGDNNNDKLRGGDGNDRIYGGLHNDRIYGDAGSDLIYGGNDNDAIYGDAGHDILYGEEGTDLIYGGDGDDIIDGGSQLDNIYGQMGNDMIKGGDGNDTIRGNDGNDLIQGGSGHDNIIGGIGDDVIYGENGKDMINGSAGNDDLFGGGGNDTINGNDGDDYMAGGSSSDILNGNDGNDVINGETGYDTIMGGDGDDILDGGYGADNVYGNAGDDVVTGGGGDDNVYHDDGP